MAKRASGRALRGGLTAIAAGLALTGCLYSHPEPGDIQVMVQMPGTVSGSASFTGDLVRLSKPAQSGAHSCFNNVGAGCQGAAISEESTTSSSAPLVGGANNTSVTSYLEFSQLQPGVWNIDLTVAGTQNVEMKICGVEVKANKSTTLQIVAGGAAPSATYTIPGEAAANASICH